MESKEVISKSNRTAIPIFLFEHFAEITFISLVCNFGGLIGMYLGISLQLIFCNIWDLTKKIFSETRSEYNKE